MSDSLTTEGLITLYQLDTTMLGGQWFYFQSAEDFATPISWGGQPYAAIPMDATGFEMTTRGTIPMPSLTISNLYGAANSLISEFKGLLGARLVRIVTLRRFLDDGSSPDANAFITRDVFVVSQKTSHNAVAIAFKLASAMDQEGVMLPRRVILRDFCTHVYRVWVGTSPADLSAGYFDYSKASCPYTGPWWYDAYDQGPVEGRQDACSKTLNGCLLRFRGGQPLPARFFPGVGRVK